jgi:hypothetical protein
LQQSCLASSRATSRLQHDASYVNGGVHQLIHGDTFVRTALPMGSLDKTHRLTPAKRLHSVMASLCVAITVIRVPHKAQCFLVADAPKQWPNGSDCSHENF